jgi:5-methylcytosine-specific restriction endonuclease McrA
MLTAAILVLDVEYRPLCIQTWKKTFKSFFKGKVEVVEYSRDKTVSSERATYQVPSVVRLVKHFKRDKIRIKFSRLNIYTRDGFRCQYCGENGMTEDLTFDHVFPRSRGGKTCWENIVTACISCNSMKANQTPEEAGMRLLSKPKKPFFLPAVMVKLTDNKIPAEWQPYWSVTLES